MKKNVMFFLLAITSIAMNAQSYIGFLTDNYSGVHGVISNPANIVDSRFRTDINLVGVSGFAANDLYGVNVFDAINDDYDFDTEANETFTNDNNIGANIDVLGPSFMFNINEKNSIAFFTRVRSFGNVNEISGETFDLLEDFDNDDLFIDEGNVYATTNVWGEIGVSYARVLLNKEQHFLKGGLSLKYLQGGLSATGFGSDLLIDVEEDGLNTRVAANGNLIYNESEDFDDYDLDDFETPEASGIGVDLGFVYEWRPNYKEYTKVNAKGEQYSLKDENKYKLKFGLSVTDIGKVDYEEGIVETYLLDLTSNDINDINDLDDLENSFYNLIDVSEGYEVKLPTALHINADYSFNNKFYVNLNTDLSLRSRDEIRTNSITNVVSLTPRFETKWFSAYIPLSVTQYSGFRAGFGFRAGPLYVGSGSVVSNLIDDDSQGADVYAGLKIPIYQGRAKDKDGDGITDKLDPCPKVAGPKENNGCPWGDEDGDGVLDDADKCPKVAGVKENNGCPILDTDKDGVLNKVDKCPKVPGAKENKGCPWKDKDKDGVLDNVDKCPKVPGVKENNGCPWGDKDKDGILDNLDKCPNIKGVATREGCPEPKIAIVPAIKEEKLKQLQSFARAIYFNSGRSTFKPGVVENLNKITSIMQEYPNANFNIEGHTDSQGASIPNQRLSDSRARAVLTYLANRGISPSRLSSVGYGEDYPIADNNTRDGRAQNRRVEIKLLRK